eukprot:4702714-Alexandrium_andersonii.AAC.1
MCSGTEVKLDRTDFPSRPSFTRGHRDVRSMAPLLRNVLLSVVRSSCGPSWVPPRLSGVWG